MAKKKAEIINSDETLIFHNKVSPNYRSLHVDGAFGGVTPKGYINLNFFSERLPIPRSSTYKIIHETQSVIKIGDSEDTKVGILREYDFGVYLNLEAAKRVSALLIQKIEELESFATKTNNNDSI